MKRKLIVPDNSEQPAGKRQRKETLFETIYYLAKERNIAELNKLVAEGISLELNQHGETPLLRLAKEGNVNAVEFLLDHFLIANLNSAAEGYARGGHIEQVEKLLARGASIHEAVLGYACGGYVEQVNKLSVRCSNASIRSAIFGYAIGGFSEQVDLILEKNQYKYMADAVEGYATGGYVAQVEALLKRDGSFIDDAVVGYTTCGAAHYVEDLLKHGASLDDVVSGYACNGYIERVEDLLKRGASLNKAISGYALGGYIKQAEELCKRHEDIEKAHVVAIEEYARGDHVKQVECLLMTMGSFKAARKGFKYSGYLRNEKIMLRMLTAMNDSHVRDKFIDKLIRKGHLPDDTEMKQTAFTVNAIMREYQLGYSQAQGLRVIGARIWLLQGTQLVKNGILLADIFLRIAGFVMNELETHDAEIVRVRVDENLLQMMNQETTYFYTKGFFSKKQYTEKLSDAADRFEKRVAMLL